MDVETVRTRYERISAGWRRASTERRTALIGELRVLALQLPAVEISDRDRNEVVALRAAILELVTEIQIGLADTH